MVYKNATAVLLTAATLNSDDTYAKLLCQVMKLKVVKFKIISQLMDDINNEDRIDEAREEGGDSSSTANKVYWAAVDKTIENGSYETGVESFGLVAGSTEQRQVLAVLDYADQLFQGACCFNMCTKCGLAYGARLWWDRSIGTAHEGSKLFHLEAPLEAFAQKDSKAKSGKYHWRCLVEWEALRKAKDIEIDQKKDATSSAQTMWNNMVDEFGHEVKNWPVLGCGAGFAPYKNGPSMVLVMQVGEDEYMSIPACRPPPAIDDAFKACHLLCYKALIHHLDLVKLWRFLPNAHPLDKEYFVESGFGGKPIVGVSRYPVKRWKDEGCEYMSQKSWIRYAYFLAAGQDADEMLQLRTIAFGLDDENDAVMENNGCKIKKTILAAAQKKFDAGLYPPSTMDGVMSLGGGAARAVDI